MVSPPATPARRPGNAREPPPCRGFPLSRTLFEAFSAFGTAGLTTGITAELPLPSQNILILLMFLGRTGPITLATALALREREPRYRYPEERPIIG